MSIPNLDDNPNSAETRAARGGMYRLLGQLWREELTQTTHAQLLAVAQEFESAGGQLPQHTGETLDQLSVDFCQLFIGPRGHLPPYQSVWQTGAFCGDALISARKFADLVGLERNPGGILEDHLGVQLEVMSRILTLGDSGDEEQQAAAVEIEREFFATHLTWPEPLLDAVAKQAATSFYQSLAAMTKSFLQMELD